MLFFIDKNLLWILFGYLGSLEEIIGDLVLACFCNYFGWGKEVVMVSIIVFIMLIEKLKFSLRLFVYKKIK